MDLKNSYMPDLERRVEASLKAEPPGVVVFALMRRHLDQELAEALWFTISPHGATLRRSSHGIQGNDPPPVREYADPEEAQRLLQLLTDLQVDPPMPTPRCWYAEAVLGSANGLLQYRFGDNSPQASLIEALFARLPAPVARPG